MDKTVFSSPVSTGIIRTELGLSLDRFQFPDADLTLNGAEI